MATVDLILPNGTVHTASLPLHPQLERQIRAGVLKLGEPAASPEAGFDGEGDAERVSASPPVEPVIEEKPVVEAMSVQLPRGNASVEEWATFAMSQGMDREEALSLKRDELRSRFTLADDDSGS